ncbi:ribosome maturation factor RimP [Eubacterium xylanophilum]|uniref:ribosome maturation factor RimP n=1 Tax=Eubacterium xylanophilum TaxID=39497 RepID=UPI0004B2DA10|nr:ribosome maturation factor RimP [Eubacterium xylanophilum]
MANSKLYEAKAEEIVMPIIDELGFEFVDVEFLKEDGAWRLRYYIDKEGGIGIEDLTVVNRKLSEIMDENDFIEEAYVLEVSSPGLFRVFRKLKDYQRNLGNDIDIKLFAPMTIVQDGKEVKSKEFVGILKGFDFPDEKDVKSGVIKVSFDSDDEYEIAVKDIAKICRYIEF